MTMATASAADEPHAGDAEASRTAAMATDDEEQHAVDDAPAHRPEEPFAEEQGDADDEQEDREEDERRRRAAERGDPADLAGDRGGLGLGEVDVGDDEGASPRRGSRRAAREGRAVAPWARLGVGGGGVRGGGSAGIWSSRGVLRLRDRSGGQRR